MLPERMSRAELRAGASLAGVYGLRILGLFFILPVFAVHAAELKGGGDLALVGIALGAYGLSQGILQIPFGLASDRWGSKPALYTGLVIFAAGSFLGIAADDIWTAIAARILQGAGAINSVAMALAADLTREQHRTKIMAMIGATIGLMFALSLVAAPVLYRYIGMGGVFALTGLLSLLAMVFFSSRRRHTRCSRDWSSDVCSSDLSTKSMPPRCASSRERNVASSSRTEAASTSSIRPCWARASPRSAGRS